MATMISIRTSDDKLTACSAACFNGRRKICECICGGMNHGVGEEVAAHNTRTHWRVWVKTFKETHPDVIEVEVPVLYSISTQTSRRVARTVNKVFLKRGSPTVVTNMTSERRRAFTKKDHKEYQRFEWCVHLSNGAEIYFFNVKAVNEYFADPQAAVQLSMFYPVEVAV